MDFYSTFKGFLSRLASPSKRKREEEGAESVRPAKRASAAQSAQPSTAAGGFEDLGAEIVPPLRKLHDLPFKLNRYRRGGDPLEPPQTFGAGPSRQRIPYYEQQRPWRRNSARHSLGRTPVSRLATAGRSDRFQSTPPLASAGAAMASKRDRPLLQEGASLSRQLPQPATLQPSLLPTPSPAAVTSRPLPPRLHGPSASLRQDVGPLQLDSWRRLLGASVQQQAGGMDRPAAAAAVRKIEEGFRELNALSGAEIGHLSSKSLQAAREYEEMLELETYRAMVKASQWQHAARAPLPRLRPGTFGTSASPIALVTPATALPPATQSGDGIHAGIGRPQQGEAAAAAQPGPSGLPPRPAEDLRADRAREASPWDASPAAVGMARVQLEESRAESELDRRKAAAAQAAARAAEKAGSLDAVLARADRALGGAPAARAAEAAEVQAVEDSRRAAREGRQRLQERNTARTNAATSASTRHEAPLPRKKSPHKPGSRIWAAKKQPPPAAEPDVIELSESLGEADGAEAEEGEEEEGTERSSSYAQESDELSEAVRDMSVSGSQSRGEWEQLPPLTQKQLKLWEQALQSGPGNEVIVKHKQSSIDLLRCKAACLRSRDWLNDEVINLYMALLLERDMRRRAAGIPGPKCHFFNTFFINKLYVDQKEYDYAAVCRWTRTKRLAAQGQRSASVLDCDKVIVPVHLGVHWICAVVSFRDQEVVWYDSMEGEDHTLAKALLRWAADETQDKRREELDTSQWNVRFPKGIPRQLNGCDCGVFTIAFADYVSRDAPFNFSQKDMEYFRKKVAADIMAQHVD